MLWATEMFSYLRHIHTNLHEYSCNSGKGLGSMHERVGYALYLYMVCMNVQRCAGY